MAEMSKLIIYKQRYKFQLCSLSGEFCCLGVSFSILFLISIQIYNLKMRLRDQTDMYKTSELV